MRTLVLQSHQKPLPHSWLEPCLESVRHWTNLNGYDYRFLVGDELFEDMAPELLRKTRDRTVIATDLARLLWMRRLLDEGYQRLIWCDADFLVLNPESFRVLDDSCAVGREVWVQQDERGRLRVYRKVHNAFLIFRQDGSLLDFYIDSATRLLRMNTGHMPAQFIGPKLLTALHNIARFPVQEDAGMLSPLVIADVLDGGGAALDRFVEKSGVVPNAVNLCASSVRDGALNDQQMLNAVSRLLKSGFARAGLAE